MNRVPSIFITLGSVAVVVGLAILGSIFYPLIGDELSYLFHRPDKNAMVAIGTIQGKKTIQPIDTGFGIVIPKIGANAQVVPNLDPYNSLEYQQALTKGIAHARGSANPGDIGNVFLFSHSSSNLFEANRYNSIFYLLTKLDKGDTIDLFYKGAKFTYTVTDKKIVDAGAVGYLTKPTLGKKVTLMTCWPPGTNLKPLIIRAAIAP